MKIPKWKYYLSYLFELSIEDSSSEHNPDLYVSLKKGRFQLSTANAVYSFADLYTNFRGAFEKSDLDRLPGKEVLVLGLGLGSIPYLLENTFHRSFYFTAIEIDETVIELASRYVLHDLQSPISCLRADAALFLAQSQEKFDLICMDIFADDVVPDEFETIAFLEELQNHLHPDGLLLYNRLAATESDKITSRAFFEDTFKKVFPEGHLLDVEGNYILMNTAAFLK